MDRRKKASPPRSAQPQPARPRNARLWIAAGLAAASALIYVPALSFEFVEYDDPQYVSQNPIVSQGLTWSNTAWAFTTTEHANWFPLTRLSHMLDFSLFGDDAGWHHFTNLVLHGANAALLFLAFHALTGSTWRSALAAALFALHPLRVESVAWVTERKDVLSGLFWILTMWAWARYARRPDGARYLWVVLWFVLGLMSKPSVVTLPAALLLLDYWPLRRLEAGWRLILEKLPLLALSAASSVVTSIAQRSGGAMDFLPGQTAGDKWANVVVSYVVYLRDTVWPAGLAALYPFQFGRPLWQVAGAAALLVLITAAAVWRLKRSPWLAVGWFWYLGVLVPMIGIVQVGLQSHADRYTYLPHIGLWMAIVWGAHSLFGARAIQAGAALAAVLALLSSLQVRHWRSSVTLFERAVHVTPNNLAMMGNLGIALMNEERLAESQVWLDRVVRRDPNSPHAHGNLAAVLIRMGDGERALGEADTVIRLSPKGDAGYRLRASALYKMQRQEEALIEIHRAIDRSPDARARADNLNTRGEVYTKLRRHVEAQADIEEALRLDPFHPVALRNLANSHAFQQRHAVALAHYEQYLAKHPDDPIAQKAAGELRAFLGKQRRGRL